ncbi:hypothetical protein [Parasphingopyxis sp.]|uniref:hypothetical protein n=1 Tax=Parasphingopyxis sp. TaxID=1920299 RepID=UPI00262E5B65|nr:hypothetical protein [Parasphingopyxis sp.]
MSVWTIDGTIESADEGRSGWAQMIYRSIVVREADGETAEHRKLVAKQDMRALIAPGLSGRFYFYKAGDQKGIYAVRAASGEELLAFPNFATWIYAICFFVSLPIFLLNWSEDGLFNLFTLTPLVATVIGAVMLPIQLMARSQAIAQFEADAGFTPDAEHAPDQ